jgi:hypothetical protein
MAEAGLSAGGTSVAVSYAPQILVPKQATAQQAAALVQKDLARSLRLGLLDGQLGSLGEVS